MDHQSISTDNIIKAMFYDVCWDAYLPVKG
jgi:hypothetical protein